MIKRLVAKFMFRAMALWDALRDFRGSSATLWVPQEGLPSPPFPIADGPDIVKLLATDSGSGTVKAETPYWKAVLADNPLVFLPLSNGAVDVSGNGYDGTATNVVWNPSPSVAIPSGFIGAAQVTGNGYIELPTTLSVSGSFTVEVWASAASTTSVSAITGSRTGNTGDTFDLKFNGAGSSGLHSDIGNGTAWLTTSANSSFNYAANTIYYLIEEVTPSGWTQFINNAQSATGTYTAGTPVLCNASNPLYVGSDGPGSDDPDANGLLMMYAVYSGSLSAASRSAHYSAAFEV